MKKLLEEEHPNPFIYRDDKTYGFSAFIRQEDDWTSGEAAERANHIAERVQAFFDKEPEFRMFQALATKRTVDVMVIVQSKHNVVQIVQA